MNKEFVKIDDTTYAVSNDNGKISFVKSDKNIEEILKKENEIETLREKNMENNNLLNSCKSGKRMQTMLYFIDLAVIIFVVSFLYANNIGSFGTAIMLGTLIGMPCTIVTTAYGFLWKSYTNSNKISHEIETDSQKIETLIKELEELKVKSNYQTVSCPETHINPMKQPTNEYTKYKVKRLVQDDNQQNL